MDNSDIIKKQSEWIQSYIQKLRKLERESSARIRELEEENARLKDELITYETISMVNKHRQDSRDFERERRERESFIRRSRCSTPQDKVAVTKNT